MPRSYLIDDRPVVIPTLYAATVTRACSMGPPHRGSPRRRARIAAQRCRDIVDGLVVARSGFESSVNYRSVVIHGQGTSSRGTHERLD